jgi:DNA adenine methylase
MHYIQMLQKPFLKWVGGKTQIIEEVLNTVPAEMASYHEPFIGGGSVLLAVLSKQCAGEITIAGGVHAYDINPHLINLYRTVQSERCEELQQTIQTYIEEYDVCTGTTVNRNPTTLVEAKTSKESYYYWMRRQFNTLPQGTVEHAALFVVINKTCFRGMYREGPNGFNVPYGHYKTTPKMLTLDEWRNIRDLIKDVEFHCMGFQESLKRPHQGDFVYLDPPYVPLSATSFVGYVKDGFGLDNHQQLFQMIDDLHKKKVRFSMSNAKTDLVTEHFGKYTVKTLQCRRAINSKKPESTALEVLVSG